jgi:hypothetical protein
MFMIVGELLDGTKIYWKKWSSASSSGRPKWVKKISHHCLFATESTAQSTLGMYKSGHWGKKFYKNINDEKGESAKNVRLEAAAT